MRCRTCGYRLWNAVPGGCSECGAPWRFEDFRFVPQVVQFCCNTCGRAYMGTDEAGLPQPRSFVCSGCGTDIDLNSMRALPSPTVSEETAMGIEHPWTERKRVGRWRAFWTTVGQALGNPRRLVTSLPLKPSMWGALWFAVIVTIVPLVISIGPAFVLPIGIMPMRGSAMGTQQWLVAVTVMVLIPVAASIGVVLSAIVSGLLTHLLLRLTGSVKHPLRWTLCTSMYCLGPMVCCALPCCGVYLSMISTVWIYISFVIATMELHEVGALRACFAVLAPPISGSIIAAAIVYWVATGP